MISIYEAKVEADGRIRLTEPALREYWDRPAEDEAWKDLGKNEEVK